MKIMPFDIDKIKDRLKADKKLVIICAAGALGVILLLLSEILPSGSSKQSETEPDEPSAVSELTYAEDIEERLTKIISSIDGAGKTKVMVTLENSSEQVYARDEKTASDSDNIKNKVSDEKEYVLIESDGKGEDGLIIKVIQPRIRGVAVVCQGGDSDVIRREIVQTVTAVLDISASRVYITKMTS